MKSIFALIISFALIASAYSQEISTKEDLTHYALSVDKSSNEKEVKENFRKNISEGKEKSPVLGAVLSGVLPGAGEFYSESYVKAGIFLALEAGLWAGYTIYRNKGNSQTDYFQSFADQNWSVRKYATWLRDQAGATSVNPAESDLEVLRGQINSFESTHFSHQLPAYGSQQYYELIGKYQNFVAGWYDASPTISAAVNYNDPNSYVNVKTNMFINYSYDRQLANDYFDSSEKFVMGVIVNHVLSAADAVWSVSMYNKKFEVKTGMRIQERLGGQFMQPYSLPTANISVQF
ncbi:MAG: hypothetical protein JSS63_03305 [Bacteroidetes bacterium]|nr:hypothetical protein [Bacteroidota bacterium]